MDFENCAQDTYNVEVSGWDAKENFFVEKTVLDWKSDDKKAILLRTLFEPARLSSSAFSSRSKPPQISRSRMKLSPLPRSRKMADLASL